MASNSTGGFDGDKLKLEFHHFGIIREFGGLDNAALFVVRVDGENFEITEVTSPGFLLPISGGKLTQTAIDKIFSKGSKPLNTITKADLFSKFIGANFLYTESYDGILCNGSKFEVIAIGKVGTMDLQLAF